VTNEVVALTKEFPNDARSWSLRARVIAEVDQLRAISHLGRAIEIDPYQEGYYLRLSLLLKELGKNKMAAQTLLGALQVLPQNDALSRQLSEFYLSFAHHYRNTKEPALALEAVERSISLSGESLDALVLRGELEENFAVDDTRKTSERTRFWERARRSFEAALLLDTTDARAAGGLGRYHKYRGYAALWEATKQVDKETVTERARREKRLRTQAMSDFARAIELGGRGEEFVAIQKQLQRYVEQLLVDGRRDLAALDFAAARARVTEAAELQPSAVNVWILTARIEEDDGFPIKARVAWRRALTVAPHSLQSLYELGKSEYTASEYKEAKAHLQKFVDLASADDGKAAALAAELNVARRIIARCVEALR
jgi:tetratricopeptide (TPR) repeat protein